MRAQATLKGIEGKRLTESAIFSVAAVRFPRPDACESNRLRFLHLRKRLAICLMLRGLY
jgi:hypothetical protein